MSKKPPKRSPPGTPVPNYLREEIKRSPMGTPPPGRLPPKYIPGLHEQTAFNKPLLNLAQLYLNKPITPLQIEPNSFLIIVDTYDWAWDIASRELLSAMPEAKGKIVDVDDFRGGGIDVRTYNVVLVYPWAATGLLNYLDPRNTVINIAGGDQLEMLHFFKSLCNRFKFYGVCNDIIKDKIVEAFPTKQVFTLTHGVDTELFSPQKRTSERMFRVGWVGKCDRKLKRFDLAKKITKEHNFTLHVAGFKSRPHHKMPNFYRSVDCLLVTSDKEAHPMIVYESMSCGVPVVTTNVGDVSRYITDGENGFILPIYAPMSEFADKINILKNNVDLREKMGKDARKTILERLSWEKIAEQYKPLTKILGVE